jgi:NTE family protein
VEPDAPSDPPAPQADPGAEPVRAALEAMPLFAQLSEELREAMLAEAELVRLPAERWLFRQGEPGDALYVISSGRLEVVRETPAPPVVLRQLGRGDSIGELALLTGAPRSAAARAIRDTELVRISRDEMLRLLHDSPSFAVALTRAIGRLLQASEPPAGRRGPAPSVLAVVPARPGAPFRQLCDALLEAMRPWARVAVLRQDELAELESGGDERFAAHGRLLDQRERDHDCVVLLGGEGGAADAWNAYCIRQADRVVAVTDARAPAAAASPELVGRSCDLVLWGPAAATTQVAGGWLRALEPRSHHYVEPGPGLGATAGRAARRLLGRSIGLVLSGGGAAGLAHVGVLAALAEGGVIVDRIGGCSFGALVGAQYAQGRTPREIGAVLREELLKRRPFSDYTFPRRALLRGRRARDGLRRIFGDRRLEQLPLNFFCVSADLMSGEVVVHRRGSLYEAVFASMSLPGIAPPTPYGGRLLVDGGVLNNLPVDVMATLDEGPVIAVDVIRRRLPARETLAAADEPGGGGPVEPAPLLGIHEILLRSSVLGSWRVGERNRARAQLVISPDVRGTGLLEFDRIDQLVSVGRAAAEAALPEARALQPTPARAPAAGEARPG